MATLRVPLLPWWLRWTGVVVVGAVIFYLSIITVPPPEPVVPKPGPDDLIPLDKWRHFLAYGLLAGCLWYATLEWELSTWKVALVVLGITVIYGVAIESWQSLTPERYFSIGDAWANAIGGLLAAPLLAFRRRLGTIAVP